MNSAKNKKIIEGIQKGDYHILKSFYKKNLPYVRRFILKNRGNEEDVEDIFQDALIVLYHKVRAGKLETKVSIHTYFSGICKNMWRNQLRKHQVLASQNWLLDTAENPEVSILDRWTQEDQLSLYQKHFSKMSESNSLLLKLFYEGKNMKMIADHMGYSEGYTRKKKYILKEKLSAMIQNDPMYQELVAS